MTAWSVLRGRAFDYSQIRSDDGDFADADMLVLGNAAIQHLSTKHDWPWLYEEATISAVVGTRDYSIATLDADWTKTAWMGIDEYKPMLPISLREAHEWSNVNRTGRPLYFAHVGNTSIRIAPYPNQAYTINVGYYQAETPLTGDADEPAVRPSGTEPKIKYYLFGKGDSREAVSASLENLWTWLEKDAYERMG